MTTINWTDPNVLIVLGLVFLLGLLLGMFLTSGGRRKWKTRYRDEVTRREQIEREHKKHREEWAAKERDWRDQDNRRATAVGGHRDPADNRPL